MISLRNGVLTKGQVGRMAKKWEVHYMTSWQNVNLTKWWADKMASWQKRELIKEKMEGKQNFNLTKWQDEGEASYVNVMLDVYTYSI
jgi:hypothetical protein